MHRRKQSTDASVSTRHAANLAVGAGFREPCQKDAYAHLPERGSFSRAEIVQFMKNVPNFPHEEITTIERFGVMRWHDECSMHQFLSSLTASIRAEDFLGLEYKVASLIANDISEHADLIFHSNAFAAITATQKFWRMSAGQSPAAERCTRLALLLAIKLNHLKSV